MKLKRELPWNSLLKGLLLLGSTVLLVAPRLHANVYATNIRLDGGTNNVAVSGGSAVTIDYILNEPASLGVTIQIRSGLTVIRSLEMPGTGPGTVRGFNEVVWDTTTDPVPTGSYSIAIVARSSGYTNWTQITSDADDLNTYVFDGRGIAVDRNVSSPYYGRVFVSNSAPGFNPDVNPGDTLGVLKFNADTSNAEEGVSSAGLDNHAWAGGDTSPWKPEVSTDDFVYVDDLVNRGEVFRWDPTISSNSMLAVLRADNRPIGAALSGPAIVGTGANTQIWMADTNQARIFKWSVTGTGICAPDDTGILVVSNTGPNLYDVALDPSGNIYTCAYITNSAEPVARVFRYHAYDPASSNAAPETNADWAVGAGDDTYAGASGLAVDPTGTYVAVSFEGPLSGGFSTNGNTKILWATNGAVAANLDLGVFMLNDSNHDDTDCAWDAVGNVYYIDNYFSRWRAVSPPGTNQATTICLATVQVTSGQTGGSIQITNITVSGGNVNIDFLAGINDSASSFKIQGAGVVNGTYSDISGAVITQVKPGGFHATFPQNPATQYFRIVRTGIAPPPTGPQFTSISVSGPNIVLTFSSDTTDTAASFNLYSGSVVNMAYTKVINPNIVQVSPGKFQATIPKNSGTQFYRIGK